MHIQNIVNFVIRLLAVFTLALSGAGIAIAEEESSNWLYAPPDSPIVAEAGFAWVKPADFSIAPRFSNCSGEGATYDCSRFTSGSNTDYDAAWGINLAGRYRLSPFVAMEIGYVRTLTEGDGRDQFTMFECDRSGGCFSQGNFAGGPIYAGDSEPFDWAASIFHAGLRLEYDAGFLSAFARGGMNLYTVDYDFHLSNGMTVSADDEGGDPYYGLGFQVGAVGGGWTRHGAKFNDTDIFHLSYNLAF